MKRSEMIKLISDVIDYEILDIPNDSYLQTKHRYDYAEYLLNKIEAAGMEPPTRHQTLNGNKVNTWERENEIIHLFDTDKKGNL